ncbi:hypothetical protein T440DRAFT_555253 [Plenodomus tracheiphilus IPT5]|uniref:Uncharacterized protein n=1 Tax=Plenodomus tracheiphilus IPT5 TaxID=1408161 RepID=A0A6A7B561_9PLEO|nr:hypothetical protein T440DRAFT_555253 [Plenodomus tracheiphilus IPT5]
MPPEPDAEWLQLRRQQERNRAIFQDSVAKDFAEFNRRVTDARTALLTKEEREQREREKSGGDTAAQRNAAATPTQGARAEVVRTRVTAPAEVSGQITAASRGVQQRPTTARKAPVGTAPAAKARTKKKAPATFKPQVQKGFTNTAQDAIDLSSDEEEAAPRTETTAIATPTDKSGKPVFKIPTATLQLFGANPKTDLVKKEEGSPAHRPSASAPTHSFASPVRSRQHGFGAQLHGTPLSRESPPVPQVQQGALRYSPASLPTSSRPVERGAGILPVSSGFHATGTASVTMFGSRASWSTPMQHQNVDQASASRQTATQGHSFNRLPKEWRTEGLPGGRTVGPLERTPDIFSRVIAHEAARKQVNFPALPPNVGQPIEPMKRERDEQLIQHDGYAHADDVTATPGSSVTPPRQQHIGNVSSSSTDQTKQSQANPFACPDQLPSPSPSLHSPAVPITPSASEARMPSSPASPTVSKKRNRACFRSTKTPMPRTSAGRRKVHDLSSDDDEDLYEPSDEEEEERYQDIPDPPKTKNTPTKIRNKPMAKKCRFADVPTSAAAAKLKTSSKNGKNGFGFKIPTTNTASNTVPAAPQPKTPTKPKPKPSTRHPSSPSSKPQPRTPSRAAKITAQQRNQEYIYHLDRSTSPSEADDTNNILRGTAEGASLQDGIRQMSITPAPSAVSAADSTSARVTGRSSGEVTAEWLAWTRARAGGDRALGRQRGWRELMAREESGEESE